MKRRSGSRDWFVERVALFASAWIETQAEQKVAKPKRRALRERVD